MKPADRDDFLATVPELSRGLVARAFSGKASPRAAIKAKCLDCTHWDRAEIADCLVILCPLHSYRPYQPQNARKRAGNASGDARGETTLPPGHQDTPDAGEG